MRLLKMEIQGLRSYRKLWTIDFTDAGLVAILGNTGAGKSSLLEALVYGLYNATTWSGSSVKELISDGEQTVRVAIEFAVDGKRYQVERSTSRANYPPSAHKIICLSDSSVIPIDGEGGVNRAVQELIGMDLKTFTSVVVLPQGKFQTLLQSDGAIRRAILRDIFRLDVLTNAHDSAAAAERRVRPLVQKLRDQRARLYDDPVATAQQAEETLQEASKEERQRRLLLKAVQDCSHQAAEASRLAADLEQVETGVRAAGARDVASELRALVPVHDKLNAAIESEQAKRSQLAARELDFIGQLAAYEERGEGPTAVAAASAVIDQVRAGLVSIAEEAKGFTEREAELDQEREAFPGLEAEATRLRENADKLEQQRDAVRLRRQECDKLVRSLETVVQTCVIAASARATANEQLETLRVGVDKARALAEAAERVRSDLSAAAQTARERLQAAEKGHAAAHLASTAKPGDPCPICARPLPDQFAPPLAPDLAERVQASERAEQAAKQGLGDAAAAQATLTAAEKNLSSLEEQERAAEEQLEQALVSLRMLRPGAEPASALGPVEKQRDDLVAEEEGLALPVQNARSEADTAATALKLKREALERREHELAQLRRALASRQTKLLASLESIVATYRPTSVDEPVLSEALIEVKAAAATLQQLATEREAAGTAVRAADELIARLVADRDKLVRNPQRNLTEHLVNLLTVLTAAAPRVGGEAPPSRPAPATLVGDVRWAKALAEAGRQIDQRLGEQVAVQCALSSELNAKIDKHLQAGGVSDVDALEQAVIDWAATAKQVSDLFAKAKDQIPLAKRLDKAIRGGGQMEAVLAKLAELLSDGKFTQFVIERRQRVLLEIASDHLKAMTNERYGFSEQFQIVDRVSNQPRSPKTLSGGETFLASLSLALGLAELAGRSGGRLGSLFLDEGFGSLDQDTLEDAMSTIEQHAVNDRLVAIVTHLSQVAAHIDRVLQVTKTPSGSQAHWIVGADREHLVESELEASLLR